jgi:hypothetical protein
MSGRGSDRKKNFKKGIDSDDSRRNPTAQEAFNAKIY